MKSTKPNIVVRMGAAHWDVQVLVPAVGEYVSFDMRKMTSKDKSNFHREFMNAFRASRNDVETTKQRQQPGQRRSGGQIREAA